MSMKEICNLVKEKGFEPKTLSTNDVFRYYTSGGDDILNETSNYLLLCEIQKWIREEFETDIFICRAKSGYWWSILSIVDESFVETSDIEDNYYPNYEEALMAVIKETLKTI